MRTSGSAPSCRSSVRDPDGRRRAAEQPALEGKRAAEVPSLVGQDHAGAAPARGQRSGEPGRTGADHEHVAIARGACS